MKKTDIFDRLDNVIGNYQEGVAKEHQGPLTLQAADRQHFAVLVEQRQVRPGATLRQQDDPRRIQCALVRVTGGLAGGLKQGQTDQQGQRGGNHEGDLMGAGHGLAA